MRRLFTILSCVELIFCLQQVQASKLVELRVVDKDYIQVYFLDGVIVFNEDVSRPDAYTNDAPGNAINKTIWYGAKLNTKEAVEIQNWTIVSNDDKNYGKAGLKPMACFRKSKLDGMGERDWNGNDFNYDVTLAHSIFIKLPYSLKTGKNYIIKINEKTNSDITSKEITFDIFTNKSEAIHVNIIGYLDDTSIKGADLYLWMGDGGARDYKSFEGKKVYIYDVNTKISKEVGNVSFWKTRSIEGRRFDYTASDVWNINFTGFSKPGTYRLAVEGVGCSQDFVINNNAYYQPFQVSTLGYFYTRDGQDSPNMIPVPRKPLYIPGKSPSNTKIYLTTMNPYHPNWKTFTPGDAWDNNNSADWDKYKKEGSPENTNATGGHGDAFDFDRHLGHISSLYDMLLPFILTNGAISDDNLGIAESGNGIPDILDEARNEADFWLLLRDGKGYGHGLTNGNKNNVLYQAANSTMAAWANAANCAMLANCFQIAKLNKLKDIYKDSAIVAYNYAENSNDQQLDAKQGVGDWDIRGRDLKMMAAAYLYNITGNTKYEDVVNAESTSKTDSSVIMNWNQCQIWGTAAYLVTKQTVHYPDLQNRMRASIINEAKKQEANYTLSRPSRRATDNDCVNWKTTQNVHRTMIAHAVATNKNEKAFFENALVLEADWGLGRNPLNMIQMTTSTTTLQNKRSVENMFTTGRNDGAPGVHPGQTPYMNTDKWWSGIMGDPAWMASFCYPANFEANWPKAEGYFNTRYVFANSEFTPQQTMRGKMALYGYLHGISKNKN